MDTNLTSTLYVNDIEIYHPHNNNDTESIYLRQSNNLIGFSIADIDTLIIVLGALKNLNNNTNKLTNFMYVDRVQIKKTFTDTPIDYITITDCGQQIHITVKNISQLIIALGALKSL